MILSPRVHSEMAKDALGYHFLGGRQMLLTSNGLMVNILHCKDSPATAKNFLAPNVDSSKVNES